MTSEEKAEAKEKVEKIIKKAKEKGKITYGELAAELGEGQNFWHEDSSFTFKTIH